MKKQELEFRNILNTFDQDFAEYMMQFDYHLLDIDGLTKINSFNFRRDYWSKPIDEVTINSNANAGNTGDHKSFCNLVAEATAPLNKLSALSLLRKYGNRNGVNGDELVKNIIHGDIYFHNLTMLDLPYCVGLSTYPIVFEGLSFGSLTSSPPKRPTSFTNQVIRWIQIASNHFAGATALTDYLQNYSYYTSLRPEYSDKERENDFQNLIHGISDEVRYAVQCFSGVTKIIFKNKTGDIFKAQMKNLIHTDDITTCSILTKEGFSKILAIKNSGEDYIYKFKLGNGSLLKVSPNHPCIMKNGTILAKDIKIGDKMCVNISPYEYSNKGDYETGRFIGLYASEGGSTKSSINLSFHIDEEEYANFIKNYASKHFCNHITEVLHPEEHCRRITIYGNEVSAFVKSFVSGNVWTKSLQSKCFDTSLEFRKGLIDGYFEGDGGINKLNGTKQAWSASLYLISDIADLMNSLGILTYVSRKNKEREDISLSCKGNRNTKKIGCITWLKNTHSTTLNKYFSEKKDENTYWIPVTDIEVSTIKHNLYDITIDKDDQLFKLPNGIIVHNSPFVNVSISSPDTMRYSMASYKWGDLKVDDFMDEIMKNQRIYANFVAKGQLHKGEPIGLPYRFPITTLVADPSFEKEYPEVWNEILEGNANLCHLNIFNSWNTQLKSLSMCCRLSPSIEDLMNLNVNNTFGSFLQVGSHAVVSVNLPKIALEVKDEDSFIMILKQKMLYARNLLKIHREEILQKRRLKYHFFFQKGYLSLKHHFFSTVGFIGLPNAIEIFGYKITDEHGLAFAKRILQTMKDETVAYAKEDGYMYNIEEVPGEGASGTLAFKDKLLNKGTYDYYDTQFVPLSYEANIFDRIKIEGELQEICTGGAISHLNVEGNPEPKALKEFTMSILTKSKLRQFAFNKGFTVCKNGDISMGINKLCPKCSAEASDYITRIVGYFTPVSSWNRAKKAEFLSRRWNGIG